MGIRSIHSDTDGTKIAFVDDHNQGYIYCPVWNNRSQFNSIIISIKRFNSIINFYYLLRFQSDEDAVMIPNFPKNCTKILWDSMPSRTFVVFESKLCTTYVYSKYSISSRCPFCLQFAMDDNNDMLIISSDKHIMKISETPVLSDQTPLILYDSELCLATNDGTLSTVVLTSHLNLPSIETKDQLKTFIDMRRFDDAWHLCKTMNKPEIWQELGKAAIAELDINFGKRNTNRSEILSMSFFKIYQM